MNVTVEERYEDLMRQYRELMQGIRMIRVAVEETFGGGALPPGEYAGATPLQESEAIARAIYASGTPNSKTP